MVAKIEQSLGEAALRPAEEPPRWGLLGARPRRAFSPRARKPLELSLREALRLRHNYIGTEHTLLGLVRQGQGLAALVLTEAGLGLADLRRRVEAAVRGPA